MNIVILMGRLTDDPEVRTSQTGTEIASYTLAVDRRQKDDKADFIRCKAFGKSAEWAGRYLKKGMKITAEGKLQTGSYKDKDGRTVYTTEVIVNAHEFCEKRESGFTSIPDAERPPFE